MGPAKLNSEEVFLAFARVAKVQGEQPTSSKIIAQITGLGFSTVKAKMKTARETVEKQGAIPGDGNDVAGLKTGAGVDTAGGDDGEQGAEGANTAKTRNGKGTKRGRAKAAGDGKAKPAAKRAKKETKKDTKKEPKEDTKEGSNEDAKEDDTTVKAEDEDVA